MELNPQHHESRDNVKDMTGKRYLQLDSSTASVLKELSTPNGYVFSVWIVVHLLIFTLCLITLTLANRIFIQIFISFFIANELHALTVLQHDCGHGSAFVSKKMNMWIGRFLAWFILMPFSTFTAIHRRHHAFLGDPYRDPDEWYYAGGSAKVFLRECLFVPRFIIKSLTVQFPPIIRKRVSYELCFNILSMALLVFIAIYYSFFYLLFFGLLLPMVILMVIINPISRGYEHYPMSCMIEGSLKRFHISYNTITTVNPIFGFLWANITYHVEHHLYPHVPFFRLPKLHKLLKNKDYIIEPYPLYGIKKWNNTYKIAQ